MTTPRIMDAMNYLDDALISEAVAYKRPNRRTLRMKWGSLAACLAVVLFVVPMSAEAAGGYVSNLLAPLFGTAQTEIVNDIGIPIGASISADGYTLSVDAIIGDRYNIAIVYTLTKEDGQAIPEKAHFKDWNTAFMTGRAAGGSLTAVRDEKDPSQLHLVEIWNNDIPLLGRLIQTTFSNLAADDDPNGTIAQGPWNVKYTLRYDDSSVSVPTNGFTVTDDDGKEIRIDKIQISPIGLHLDLTLFDPAWGGPLLRGFDAAIQFTDGTIMDLETAGGGSGFTKGGKTAAASYSALFESPVDLEDVAAIIICGSSYAVDLY